MPPSKCRGEKDDGSPCGAPENLVDPSSGFCPAHDPEKREKVREAARKGGEATRRKRRGERGVKPPSRWGLDSYADVRRWLFLVFKSVVAGNLSHQQAKAAVRTLEAWMTAYDRGQVTDELDELGDALAEWKETGDPTPVLELVK